MQIANKAQLTADRKGCVAQFEPLSYGLADIRMHESIGSFGKGQIWPQGQKH